MKKALCIVSGMLLILSGCAGLFVAFVSFRFRTSMRYSGPIWFDLIYNSWFFTSPILIMAGGWLYSFKRAAWRLAVVAHGIVLLHLMAFNVLLYIVAVGLGGVRVQRHNTSLLGL